MITTYLKDNIQFRDKIDSWEEGIILSAQPLLKSKAITEEYIDAMIENVHKNGSYIVILPEIAIPHAHSEYGALETSLSFLNLNEPVLFPDGTPVKLMITISSESSESHLEVLMALTAALMDEMTVSNLKNAKTEQEVLNIFESIKY